MPTQYSKDFSSLRDEVERFDANLPLESAWLPPSSWYNDPRFYALERHTVFRNNWLIAGRADQVRQPGGYVAGVITGEPHVIVRDEHDRLNAFFNVCRHHAAQVMAGAGCAESLVCPYHGWTYGLDGRLLRAPELGAVKDFDRESFGLVPMSVESWCDLLFIHMAKSPPPLAPQLSELASRLSHMQVDSLKFVARRKYRLECNWKVYVDNYLDGGYHVGYLHRGLAAQLDMESYRVEVFDRYSIQSGSGAGDAGASGSDFSERIGERVLYAWLYPNLMINRYGPMMDTNWVIPIGHDTTEVIFDYYFTPETARDPEFVAKSLAASDVVQRGLGSASYDRGRYSVRHEQGELHFHRLLARDFRAAF
jgi:choline monooxygenase